jgi:hypothetical protein
LLHQISRYFKKWHKFSFLRFYCLCSCSLWEKVNSWSQHLRFLSLNLSRCFIIRVV